MAGETVLYTWDELGAPVLNNAAGALLDVLQVLVSGFRPLTVSALSVSGGVATATCAAHGYVGGPGRLVEIQGATVAAANALHQITPHATDPNAFTFPLAGVPDGLIGGTITARRAPLGYTLERAGTVGVLRRGDPAALPAALRVVHAGGSEATVQSCESVAGTTTVIGGASVELVYPGADTSAAKAWWLIASGRMLYIFNDHRNAPYDIASSGGPGVGWWWGDLTDRVAGDVYAVTASSRRALWARAMTTTPDGAANLLRAGTGVAGAVQASLCCATQVSLSAPGSDESAQVLPPWPGYGGRVWLDESVLVRETNATLGHPIRGRMPGLAMPLQRIGAALHRRIITVQSRGVPRTYFMLAYNAQANPAVGCAAWDLGPWY